MLRANKILENSYLFNNLNKSELDLLLSTAEQKSYRPGEVLIKEGQLPEYIFIILNGVVEITKHSGGETKEHVLTVLKKGETIGEMGFLDLQHTSASAICKEEATVIAINISALRNLKQASDILLKITNSIAGRINQRLRYTNEVTVESLQAELLANQKISFVLKFFVSILVVLVGYIFTLSVAIRYGSVLLSTTLITIPFLFVFLLLSLYFLKTCQMPLSFFGLTLKNWRFAVWDAFKFTILALVMISLFKWALIEFVPRFAAEPFFNPFDAINPALRQTATVWTLVLLASAYSLFSIVQEYLTRGLFQSSIEYLFPDNYKKWGSIIAANLIFSALHLHVSLAIAVLVFIPGLLWGWLYYRSHSLVGVSLSHILIGVMVGYIINFNFILRS